ELDSRLRSLSAVNAAIANELAARVQHGQPTTAESLLGLRRNDPEWAVRQLCAWEDGKALSLCRKEEQEPFSLPKLPEAKYAEIVSDRGRLYLRAAITLPAGTTKLIVVSSEPLDRDLLDRISRNLGEITLYASGFDRPAGNASPNQESPQGVDTRTPSSGESLSIR